MRCNAPGFLDFTAVPYCWITLEVLLLSLMSLTQLSREAHKCAGRTIIIHASGLTSLRFRLLGFAVLSCFNSRVHRMNNMVQCSRFRGSHCGSILLYHSRSPAAFAAIGMQAATSASTDKSVCLLASSHDSPHRKMSVPFGKQPRQPSLKNLPRSRKKFGVGRS